MHILLIGMVIGQNIRHDVRRRSQPIVYTLSRRIKIACTRIMDMTIKAGSDGPLYSGLGRRLGNPAQVAGVEVPRQTKHRIHAWLFLTSSRTGRCTRLLIQDERPS